MWLRVSMSVRECVCVCGVLCLLSTLGTVCTAAKGATQQHLRNGHTYAERSIQISFYTHFNINNCVFTLIFMRLFLFTMIFILTQSQSSTFSSTHRCESCWVFGCAYLSRRLTPRPPHRAPVAPLGVHAGVIRCSDKLHYLAGLCEMRALY